MSNPFWEFSLASYRGEAAIELLLRAQDEFAVDVNLLLYALWLASRQQRLDVKHLTMLELEIAPWRARAVQPLRRLRRQWRDYPQAAALREQIKSLELAAECEQQAMMWDFYCKAEPLAAAGEAQLDNLLLLPVAAGCDESWREFSLALLASLPVSAAGLA